MKVLKIFCLAVVVAGLIWSVPGFAQSITSGDIAGVVTDPSGAVIPNAKVTAKNDATGAIEAATTNGEGFYRFSFLQIGSYTVTVNAAGFQPGSRKIQVTVAQTVNGNIGLAVTAATTTVEVTTTAVQAETASVVTTFSAEQVSLVPNPGNDLSAIAQTSPGVVMNTQGGFGNFSTNGLPGTSNLFTVNGMNDNDPFLNLNNSGATTCFWAPMTFRRLRSSTTATPANTASWRDRRSTTLPSPAAISGMAMPSINGTGAR